MSSKTMEATMVMDARTSRSIVASILHSSVPVVGAGMFYDSTDMLCLITLKHWEAQRIWIFDVKIHPALIFEGELGRLFTSADIRKVMHDSRHATKILERDYGVLTRNVFDTQLAFDLHREEKGIPKRQATLEEMERYFCVDYDFSRLAPSGIYETTIPDYWRRRPLSKGLQLYAARLTFSLTPYLYKSIINELAPETVHLLDSFIEENVYRVLSHQISNGRHQQRQTPWY